MKNQMTPYIAVSIIEGFSDEEATYMETLEAWAYLIKTGQVWSLQGFYGRGATDLIENGWITKDGQINMDTVHDYEERVDEAAANMGVN